MAPIIRPVTAADRSIWGALYAAYAEFYAVDQTEDMRDLVWGWLMDPQHPVFGLVAEQDGTVIGLAHLRPFARPLAAATGGFLDDLFVTPASRGSGAADALLAAAQTEGQRRGWSVVRWITAADNARARKVYDRTATATPWVTYDLAVE